MSKIATGALVFSCLTCPLFLVSASATEPSLNRCMDDEGMMRAAAIVRYWPDYPKREFIVAPPPTTVTLQFDVDYNGIPKNIEMLEIRSEGRIFPEFGDVSVEALAKWRFNRIPYTQCRQTFNFVIEGSKQATP